MYIIHCNHVSCDNHDTVVFSTILPLIRDHETPADSGKNSYSFKGVVSTYNKEQLYKKRSVSTEDTMNPAIIQTVSQTLPKSSSTMSVTGVIEKTADKNQLLLKTATGTIPLNVESNRFSNGDPVTLTFQNGSFRLEKSGEKIDNIEIDKDTFLRNTAPAVRLSDILEHVKQSVVSGNSSLISESVKTALDIINDKPVHSGIDKTLLTATVKAIDIRLEQSGTLSKDAIDSLIKLRNALQTIILIKPELTMPSFGLTAATSLKNGIHRIPMNTLLAFIDNSSISPNVKKIFDSFRDISGNIAVRVSGDTQNKIITPLPGSLLQREFQSVITSMKSSLLQSVPLESLDTLLLQKGSVDLDTLTKLDNQLIAISSRFSSERAGSRTAAIAVISSWLSQSIDNIGSTALPFKFPPALPQSLQNDFEIIDALLHKSTTTTHTKLSPTGITETMLIKEARPDALPQSFSKLGFDNESQMLRSNTVSSTIKTELLKLLPGDSNNSQLQEQKAATDLRAAAARLNNLIESIERNNQLTKQLQQSSITQLAALKEQLSATLSSLPLQMITDNIDKIIKLLGTFNGNSSELSAQLKDKAGTLFELLTMRLPGRPDETIQQKERLSSEQFTQSGQNQTAAETMLKIRGTVESAINKLESLQLLARQIPLSDGTQQQILALPMKVGDEWTELNVRFLKKESNPKKKKSGGTFFTVQISIAPANLGAISVKMDYHLKKSLKISMDLEKDVTRSFFQKNNFAIKNALSKLGLPVFSIDIRKDTEKSTAQDEIVLDQQVDVKV
ncbi:MAG: hypothetical protein GX639_01760 [Fibrobacter sp.]|nr:hypothetical protein [Fibrobacter sp.]